MSPPTKHAFAKTGFTISILRRVFWLGRVIIPLFGRGQLGAFAFKSRFWAQKSTLAGALSVFKIKVGVDPIRALSKSTTPPWYALIRELIKRRGGV